MTYLMVSVKFVISRFYRVDYVLHLVSFHAPCPQHEIPKMIGCLRNIVGIDLMSCVECSGLAFCSEDKTDGIA